MERTAKVASLGWMGLFLVTLLTLTFLGACHNRLDKDDEERQVQSTKGTSRTSVENGQAVLNLDSPTQNRLGLEVAALTVTVTPVQVTSVAMVLSVQDLGAFRNSYIAAQAQLQKSRVEVDVAGKEYTRLKALFEQNQNVSERSLQAAEGTWKGSEAEARAEEQQLKLQESIARQEWGNVVAKWAVEGSSELQRILDQRVTLLQMTMPSGTTLGVPRTISLEIPGGTRAEARLVSIFPRVDPRIQGRSFLYVAPAQAGLVPGTNLLAHLSVGRALKGLIVPSSAVVWSEGKSWLYQQTASDRFARRAVPTDVPVESGFFVTQGFSPGDKVVTQGAQALLSEELLLHGQGGGESDED